MSDLLLRLAAVTAIVAILFGFDSMMHGTKGPALWRDRSLYQQLLLGLLALCAWIWLVVAGHAVWEAL